MIDWLVRQRMTTGSGWCWWLRPTYRAHDCHIARHSKIHVPPPGTSEFIEGRLHLLDVPNQFVKANILFVLNFSSAVLQLQKCTYLRSQRTYLRIEPATTISTVPPIVPRHPLHLSSSRGGRLVDTTGGIC